MKNGKIYKEGKKETQKANKRMKIYTNLLAMDISILKQ